MATLDQVFQRERAWIAASVDMDALMDKIGEWRDDVGVAERDGIMLMRMRAGDLIELAQGRIVGLKALAIRADAAHAPAAASKVVPAEDRPVQPRAVERSREVQWQATRPTVEGGRAPHAAHEVAALAAAEKAKADARIAAANAAKIELQNELLRAQVEAARRVTVAPVVATARSAGAPAPKQVEQPKPLAPPWAPSTALRPPLPSSGSAPNAAAPSPVASAALGPTLPVAAGPTMATAARAVATVSHGDQLALTSVGRWPSTGPPPGHPFYSRDQDWPADWTLTGLDLARFRGGIQVTQKVLAAQLGVTTAVIAELEKKPREKVGPAMRVALRKAIDVVAEQERRRRGEAAQAMPTTGAATKPGRMDTLGAANSAGASPRAQREPAAASNVLAAFTGGDLARLRTDRKLSQRQFAEVLGVGYGMVAKAEVAAGEPLGERMRVAVGALLAAGADGATG